MVFATVAMAFAVPIAASPINFSAEASPCPNAGSFAIDTT